MQQAAKLADGVLKKHKGDQLVRGAAVWHVLPHMYSRAVLYLAGLDSAWETPAASLAKACNRRPCLAHFQLPRVAPDCCTVPACRCGHSRVTRCTAAARQRRRCRWAAATGWSWSAGQAVLLRWEAGLAEDSCIRAAMWRARSDLPLSPKFAATLPPSSSRSSWQTLWLRGRTRSAS